MENCTSVLDSKNLSKNRFSVFLLFFILAPAFYLNAQIISQNFDGLTAGTLPAGWTVLPYSSNPAQADNNSAPATGTGWKVIQGSSAGLGAASSPNAIICGASVNQTSSDWFFTNSVSLQSGTFYKLSVSAAWTSPMGLSGAPPVEFGYLRDVNGNGIPEPLGADASGYVDWSGLGSGTYTWNTYNVGFTVPASGNYFIFVLSLVAGSVITELGPIYVGIDNFILDKGTGIQLTSPVGGEVWNSGSTHNITWASNGVNNVKIEYSLDFGSSWTVITASTAASSGSYTWNLPVVSETKNACLVRITDVSNTSVKSESSPFTIQVKEPGSISIYAPQGGETWAPGTQQWIGFTASNVGAVDLYYSTDNGVNWIKITGNLATGAGGYAWTVPNTSSQQCRIKVIDSADNTVYAISNIFSISGTAVKSISLIVPNGGEVWAPNTSHNIQWISSLVTNVKLEYSSNSGTSWNTITSSVAASPASYLWTTPNIASSNCLVRVSDATSSLTYDVSDAVFTIDAVKSVTVISPNGGESWDAGTVHQITWNSSGLTAVKIEYSSNSGSTWNVIHSAFSAAAGSYDWTLPNVNSTTCLVRVSDYSNAAISDISNAVFSINYDPNPWITIAKPVLNDKYFVGDTITVIWSSHLVGNCKIELSKDDGVSWSTMLSSIPAVNGKYAFIAPNTPSTVCKVRVSNADASIINSVSERFTIARSIIVKTPVAGATYPFYSLINVTWESRGVEKVNVKYYSGGTLFYSKDSVSAADGWFAFTPPNTSTSWGRIVVSDVADDSVYGEVKYFSVDLKYFIQITSPRGGEQWEVGTTQKITWTQYGVYNLQILYSTNNGSTWLAAYPTKYNLYATWIIPNTVSDNCVIKIGGAGSVTSVYDTSEIFSIVPKKIHTLALTSPAGGELYPKGSTQQITWTSANVTDIKIEYSIDGGSSWVVGTASVKATDGKYMLTFPSSASNQCLIRLTDLSDASIQSVSSKPFTLFGIALTAPAGGESLQGRQVFRIKWTSENLTLVKLEYTFDGGTTWRLIKDSVDASAKQFDWSVPNLSTASGYIRVVTINAAPYTVTCDTPFSVTKTTFPNLIVNGDFANGAANWNSYIDASATASFTFTGGAANLTITKGGTQGWHIQLLQNNIAVENGKTYDLIFQASAAATRTVDVGISQNSGNYTAYGSQIFTIGTTPQTYSFSFKMTAATDNQARFCANLGNSNYGVRFDDIILREHDFEKDVKVIAPVKGAQYLLNDKPVISWTTQNISLVNIYYKLSSNTLWSSIVQKVTAGLGNYTWSIPAMLQDSCQIKIEDSADPQMFALSDKFYVNTVTAVSDENGVVSKTYNVSQNYPNPFNPTTTISYELPARSHVTIEIFNLTGEYRENLFDNEQEEGVHFIMWKAKGPSGVYIYRIDIKPNDPSVKPYTAIRKMIFMK